MLADAGFDLRGERSGEQYQWTALEAVVV